MPRFYFEVREGSRFLPDDEGLEFPGLDEAEREAGRPPPGSGGTAFPPAMPERSQLRSATSTASRCSPYTVSMQVERVVLSPVAPVA